MQNADHFRAMDTDIDVIIEADSRPLAAFLSIRALFGQQEERFSRFRPDSLLSRLNRGESIRDGWLARACRLAIRAHELSGGLYNPMILPALTAAGYNVTFSEVSGGEPRPGVVPDPRDCLSLEDDAVTLRGGGLDLGGIIKGWTVDLGIELLQGEYPNIFINAGGDLRCAGAEPGVHGWMIAIESPVPGLPDPWEGAVSGAVATSTTLKRRWRTGTGAVAHHLIDPRTGLPAESSFAQVTVWAPETWLAEVWTKAVLIGGETAAGEAAKQGHRVVAIRGDGSVLHL